MMPYLEELRVAIRAVRKAGAVCRRVAQGSEQIRSLEKDDRSPVTLADFAGQAVISRMLQNVFSADPIVGEETPEALEQHPKLAGQVLALARQEAEFASLADLLDALRYCSRDADFKSRYWTLDPIDGTKGFLRGDQYAAALALVENGRVVLGVLGCPNFSESGDRTGKAGRLFYAVKGGGARMLPLEGGAEKPVRVDAVADSENARICESVESAHSAHDSHGKISDALGIRAEPIRMDSQVKYALVAKGDASIYLRLPRRKSYREKIWDHAAGSIIVEEAGGRVTDFSGAPLDFSIGKYLTHNRGIVATNGNLHRKVLDAIAEVM